jgi:hypothetical protein
MVHKLVDSPTVRVPPLSVKHFLGNPVKCFTCSCGSLAAKVMKIHDALAPLVCMQNMQFLSQCNKANKEWHSRNKQKGSSACTAMNRTDILTPIVVDVTGCPWLLFLRPEHDLTL